MLPIDLVIPSNKVTVGDALAFRDARGLGGTVGYWLCDVHGNANVKRNRGAKYGNQPFLFFCDDDVFLAPGILLRMVSELLLNPNIAYCYCDFVVWNHPCQPKNWVHKAAEFDPERLRQENYISTMSLIRRDAFEAVGGFSEEIERLQDWDLWLKMLKVGLHGVYLPEIGFFAQYSSNGITKAEGYAEACQIVRRKHNL